MPPRQFRNEIKKSHELWVYKEVGLTIRVVSELDPALGFDPTQVRINWSVLADASIPITEQPQGPWNDRWAKRHGFQSRVSREPPNSDGHWTGRIPRFRGMEIRGTVPIPTVAPAVVALPILSRDVDSVEVVLTFRSGRRRIHGQLVSSTGKPLGGTPVKAYVATRVKTSELSFDRLRSLGYAFTVVGDSEGESVLTLSAQVMTDADGRYELSLPQDGELLVVVHAADHSPSRTRMVTTSQEQEIGIEATYMESPAEVRFLNAGQPMPQGSIVLTDLTSEPFQTNAELALDKASSVKAGWFEVGREYAIMARMAGKNRNRYYGFIKWDGRSEVDLADLPGNLSEFRKK